MYINCAENHGGLSKNGEASLLPSPLPRPQPPSSIALQTCPSATAVRDCPPPHCSPFLTNPLLSCFDLGLQLRAPPEERPREASAGKARSRGPSVRRWLGTPRVKSPGHHPSQVRERPPLLPPFLIPPVCPGAVTWSLIMGVGNGEQGNQGPKGL